MRVLEAKQMSLILGTDILSDAGDHLRVVETRRDGKHSFLTVEVGPLHSGIQFALPLLRANEEEMEFAAALSVLPEWQPESIWASS